VSKRRPAPWVPLSVYYFDDEALIEAGEFAETMFTRMMAYAGRHRDWNGRLPRAVVLSRLGLVALESAPESAPESRLEALLESGLVSAQGAHIVIEGWLKWNDAGERVEQSREQDRERKNAVTSGDADAVPESAPEVAPESAPDSGTVSDISSGAQDKKREEKKERCASADAPARFDEFWSVYPERKNKQPAIKAWKNAVKVADPEVIIAGARRYALWLHEQRSKDATTKPKYPDGWLNAGRWEDELDAPEQPPEQRGSFTAPPLPEDAPRSLYVPWNRAHRDAWLAGKQGPTDWRQIQVAS
jgi:hypothetical protein